MIEQGKRMIDCNEEELQYAAKFDKNTMQIYEALQNLQNSDDEEDRMIVEGGLFDPTWDGACWEGIWD